MLLTFLGNEICLLPHASEPDLTVDLRNYGIDVSSGCVLSLVARDTVATAVEKLTDKFTCSVSCCTCHSGACR